MFTSGLSANEFALLGRLGPRPVAQVMGASVIRTGWQYLPALTPGESFVSTGWGYSSGYPSATGYGLTNRLTEPSFPQVRSYVWRTPVVCELDALTDAWNTARRQAIDRLAEEALQAGADAVVGVRVERDDHRFGAGLIEYVVTGTAVRLPGSTLEDWPVLTHLSGQDYWRLHTSGYGPAGFLGATAVVFASPPRATRLRRARSTARNQELDELSQGFHLARENVRRRLRDQVADARAWGAVGVKFEHAVHRETFHLASSIQTADRRGWHRGRLGVPYYVSGHADTDRKGWVITMHATGTAIAPSTAPRDQPVKPAIRMNAP